ncbi:DUF3071 domain-containing protein [Nocardioides sp. R-N-C8]|nr:DUF3071 domain-containing protein [Nocardioides nematodiphilus]
MSAEEMPLTSPVSPPEQDADTRPVSVTLASVTRDGRRAILVDEQGREFTLALDPQMSSQLDPRGRPAAPQTPTRRTEVPMESAMRPRDIQARIRAGESPEQVAEAAGSTVEKIMPFAGPALAEREYTAQRAQKASVRRKPGEAAAARTLGDAVTAHLRGFDMEPESADASVVWDSYRRHDGRWKLLATYDLPNRAGIAELTYDIPGNYVSLDNDDARWLVGEVLPEPIAPEPVRDDLELARLRRLQPIEEPPAVDLYAPVEPEPVAEVSATEPTVEIKRDEARPAETETAAAAPLEVPVEAYLFDAPPATPVEKVAEAEPEHEVEAVVEPEPEKAPEPEAPRKPTSKRRGRASVPSWDEIMFGGPSK